MVLCIGQFVEYVQLDNTSRNSIVGHLVLLDDTMLFLDLGGNLPPPLAGKRWRFHNPNKHSVTAPEIPEEIDKLEVQQIGVIGELAIRADNANQPDTDDQAQQDETSPPPLQCDGIEWFGQNGQVVVEGPLVLELVTKDQKSGPPASAQWGQPISFSSLLDAAQADVEAADEEPPHDEHLAAGTGKHQNGIHGDEQVEASWDSWEEPDGMDDESEFDDFDEEDQEDDLFEMMSDEQAELFQRFAEAAEETLARARFMEELNEAEEEPVPYLLPEPLQLPKPDDVQSEEEAEKLVRVVLAQLARLNISVRNCPHLNNRDIYRILVEHLLPEATAPASLAQSGVVMYYDTLDYCPECKEEIDAMAEAGMRDLEEADFSEDEFEDDETE